jgi:uncharacterized protein (DUF362 family)
MMVHVIRWVCPKCNKKWIHPVEKCLYDGSEIKKVIGKKTKVVGCTKVFIPNPLHPIYPYNVLILEDEHGHRMPKKTMKDYQVGDSYVDTPDASENAIAVVKIKYDHGEAVKEALELIGDVKVDKKTKILIKPNLSIPGYSYLGMCTNPRVLEGVIDYLLEKGAKAEHITIAEQSFFVPIEKAIDKSGTPEIVEKYKVNFVDISKTEFIEKKEREFAFEVSKIAYEADIIFNVPSIKTDTLLGIDGAFENLTRFLSKKNFSEFSQNPMKAAMALAAFPKIFPKFITIGDASIGLQGNGPAQNGEPGFYDMIFAARNPVVHDTAIAEIFCMKKLPYVELAGQMGLGEYNLKKIKFIGNELEAVKREIKQPIGSRIGRKEE